MVQWARGLQSKEVAKKCILQEELSVVVRMSRSDYLPDQRHDERRRGEHGCREIVSADTRAAKPSEVRS
jgi:hypothetical protein